MKSLFLLLSMALLPGRSDAAQAAFWELDPLPGGADISYDSAISADGRIIAGESFSALSSQHGEGVRWIRHSDSWTTNGLGLPAEPPSALNSPGLGLSSNGKVMVGRVSFARIPASGFETLPYCWTENDGFKFPLPPAGFSGAQAQSATSGASTVVGWGWRFDRPYYEHPHALVWRGSLAAGWRVTQLDPFNEGLAIGVDVSGRLIIGWARSPASVTGSSNGIGHEAVCWVRSHDGDWQARWLGALPHAELFSQAIGLTRDTGRFVVGFSGDPSIQSTPVRWKLRRDQPSQIEALGLPTGFQNGSATAISSSGRRVVGSCNRTSGDDFIPDTFVWDEGHGTSLLQDRLIALGLTNVIGWTLTWPTGISDDGRTICGYGTNPQGIERTWVALLPENQYTKDREELKEKDSDQN
jgi:uncharacterized membrane protein